MPLNAAASVSLGNLTLTATGRLALSASLAVTLGDLTPTAAAGLQIKATLSVTLGALSLVAMGHNENPYIPSGLRRVALDAQTRSVTLEAIPRLVVLTQNSPRRASLTGQTRRIAA